MFKPLKGEMLGYYKSVYIVKTIWTLQSIYLAVKGSTDSFSKKFLHKIGDFQQTALQFL